ncbi:type I restriction-modification enzyme R subunit C-terminal domain-containing protein [Zafaria sp. Z1313]|uniref:type I restriction-modification enzyme R subunit C-terminal domain-containing protein n=1 Tax=Zafaria sp. Z1313 TaxID=3423202 RepID=UPI003D301C6D
MRRKPVYADFEDTVGELTEVELEGVRHSAFDISFYRERVEVYVREHLDHMAVQRLRRGLPLTEMDLRALEEMLAEGGVGSAEDLERAAAGDVAGFIRSLVGLDQQAVQDAFADFIAETTLNSRQLELLNMIIKQLTRGGPMDAGALYEPPYTDIAAGGPEALFPEEDVDRIVSIINRLGGPALPEPEDSASVTA